MKREATETVTVTADEAEFIADAIQTAYPADVASREWWAITERLRAKDGGDHAE